MKYWISAAVVLWLGGWLGYWFAVDANAADVKRVYVIIGDISNDTVAASQGWMTVEFVSPSELGDTIPRDTNLTALVGMGAPSKSVPANGTINGQGAQVEALGTATIDLVPTSNMTPDSCKYRFTVVDGRGVVLMTALIPLEGTTKANLVDLLD